MTLGMTTNTTVVTSEGDGLLVGNNVVKILFSLDQRHVSNGTTDFTSVLEVDSEVGTTSLTTYKDYNSKTEKLLFLVSAGVTL